MTEHKRIRGWESRLTKLHASRMRTLYAWGSHDCCMFGADSVREVIGVDFAAPFRDRYSTKEEAYALLKEIGCDGIGGLVSMFLPEIMIGGMAAPALARRGDIILAPSPEGDFVAVVDGMTAIGPDFPRGCAHVAMTCAVRAWRVG